ncbi:hypothetical protein B0H17DRAFT_1134039 [Mycena rosella]|uniref:Uncharacterized protein n=1 Tax=Mycena rosella TaxID=1033263 RepID=A0AAD7DGT0_MYCRO|nr:hypothetical protein B0H17DRAFT_1134039 [Mycena rosella]
MALPENIRAARPLRKAGGIVHDANIERWGEALAGLTLPTLLRWSVRRAAAYTASGRTSDLLAPEEAALLEELGPQIQRVIVALSAGEGGCFMKLSSRSPKDAAACSGVFDRHYAQTVRAGRELEENRTKSEDSGSCARQRALRYCLRRPCFFKPRLKRSQNYSELVESASCCTCLVLRRDAPAQVTPYVRIKVRDRRHLDSSMDGLHLMGTGITRSKIGSFGRVWFAVIPAITSHHYGALKCQAAARRLNRCHDSASAHDSDDEENIPPDDYLMPLTHSKGEQTAPRTTLKAQLVEKDARITELEAANSALSADLLQLRKDHAKLSLAHQTFPTAITTFLRSTEA